MTLQAYSARISYGGPDRLNITRKSGSDDGLPFAPSWEILAPALQTRRTDGVSADLIWPRYREAYIGEMRTSYRRHRAAWDALLARERVVLVCYCVDAEHCHRAVLREILTKLGALDYGELSREDLERQAIEATCTAQRAADVIAERVRLTGRPNP